MDIRTIAQGDNIEFVENVPLAQILIRAYGLAKTADLLSPDADKGDKGMTVKRSEAGTVATTQHVVNQERPMYLRADFEAVGDGVADDTAKVLAAIASGAAVIDGNKKTYRITSEVNFNVAEQTWRNARFLFDGSNTTRIARFTANDLSFERITFDGNGKQPSACLTYIASNTKRPHFIRCVWKNMLGTGFNSNALNHMYGLLISPYGVEDFLFDACRWFDFAKHNDGTFFTATAGCGATGAIFFLTDDFAEPNTAQTSFTGGEIRDCSIDNVQTIMAAGLSANDRVEFDDADGIRFYGSSVVDTWLNVRITNLKCRKVSKRGVKLSASRGVEIDGLLVDGRGMQYGMVTAVKLDNDCVVKKVRAIAGSYAKRFVGPAYQMQGHENALLEDSTVDFCATGFQFLTGMDNKTLRNVHINRCRFEGVEFYGVYKTFRSADLLQEDLSIRNTKIVGESNTAKGLALSSDSNALLRSGYTIENVVLVNCDAKIEGSNIEVCGLRVVINSTAYAGSAADVGLVEIGAGRGYGGFTRVNGLSVDAAGINVGYLSAERPYLVYLTNDVAQAANLAIKVPEGLSTAKPHLEMWGDDSSLDGLEYFGPGSIRFGSVAAAHRWSAKNLKRRGDAACTTPFVKIDAASTYYEVDGVSDFRPTTATSVVGTAGTNGIASNIRTRSSNATPTVTGVAKTGGVLATF